MKANAYGALVRRIFTINKSSKSISPCKPCQAYQTRLKAALVRRGFINIFAMAPIG